VVCLAQMSGDSYGILARPTWSKRDLCWGNLNTASGASVGETIVKDDILL
jgi:hypothetical protein